LSRPSADCCSAHRHPRRAPPRQSGATPLDDDFSHLLGGEPFEFKLGKGQVIPGWDTGIQGMKVGGRRKLTIPSAMAYGARGVGGVIEPHEPLVFVVDLLSVR
jgi:hypothetical protein